MDRIFMLRAQGPAEPDRERRRVTRLVSLYRLI